MSELSASLETKLDKVDVVDPGAEAEAGKAADAKSTYEGLNRVLGVASDARVLAESKADQSALEAHVASTNNPHAVTAEQINAYTKDDVETKLAKKADRATTLSGYGITDGATKTEIAAKADIVDGKVPAAQLPSYVDDVLEYDTMSAFPATGESSKIYVAKDTNLVYRWSGTQFVEISPSPTLDNTVTDNSPNGVKSSGIWSWVKSLLPHWLTGDYAEPATVASVADKRDMDDLAVYSGTRTENTDWTWTGENAEIVEALNNAHSKPYHADVGGREAWADIDPFPFDMSEYNTFGIEDADLSATSLWYKLRDMASFEVITVYATRPRYMDETLGPEKPNQQLAAVATGDAQTPADGDLMKYDAANDRFVKAIPSEDYATEAEVSQKADRATTLSGYGITDAAPLSMISATDTTFASAVRAVPTTDMPEDVPTDWGTYGTVGAALAALAAFVKWAKAKIVSVIGNDGKPTDQFATDLLGKQVAKEAIIYKANTATGLKDRAFNALSLDGTEYNLSTALAAVTPTVENQPRDLLIVATATASTTISFTAGTIKGDKPTIDGAGTWLITLTEYAANTWYCRQIKMEDAA